MLKDQGERRVSRKPRSGEQKAAPGISRSGTTAPKRIGISRTDQTQLLNELCVAAELRLEGLIDEDGFSPSYAASEVVDVLRELLSSNRLYLGRRKFR